MATNEGADNNMQFFFTLDQTPELQNTHTIFGKITGETIYNALKLNDTPTDQKERPINPHKINKVKILHNPFADLTPRVDRIKSSKDDKKDDKRRREGVKNFKLISFGEEAEQDEIEVVKTAKKSEPAPSTSSSKKSEKKEEKRKRSLTPPLPSKSSEKSSDKSKSKKRAIEEDSDSDYELSLEKEKQSEIDRKKREIQEQIKDIKRQYHKKDKKVEVEEPKSSKNENEVVQDYLDEKEKYKQQKEKTQLKGASRENFTLQLLAKFKNKLQGAVEKGDDVNQENSDDETWLGHKLDFSESADAVLAKDASKKADDWYDIYDPRNPLNKRKRGGDGEKKKK